MLNYAEETVTGTHEKTIDPALAPSATPRWERSEAGQSILTAQERAYFEENGFLRLESFASPEDVAEIRAVVKALFEKKAGFAEGAHFNFAGHDDDSEDASLPQIIGPHNFARHLQKTQFFKNASTLAEELLGPEVRFGNDHTLMKPAVNGPATPWHQDEAFRNPSYDYNEISIWMPLQDVNQVNGCMEFIPGTHLREILPHRSLNDDPKVHVLECNEGYNLADRVVCDLPAGGCTIHTGRTLHGAGPNRSNGPRYAYVLNFAVPPVPAKTPRSFPWLEGKSTARQQRMKEWLWRGGLFIETWRTLRNTEWRDYGKLAANMKRKAHNALNMFKR